MRKILIVAERILCIRIGFDASQLIVFNPDVKSQELLRKIMKKLSAYMPREAWCSINVTDRTGEWEPQAPSKIVKGSELDEGKLFIVTLTF